MAECNAVALEMRRRVRGVGHASRSTRRMRLTIEPSPIQNLQVCGGGCAVIEKLQRGSVRTSLGADAVVLLYNNIVLFAEVQERKSR
jgi:hypothetical protein